MSRLLMLVVAMALLAGCQSAEVVNHGHGAHLLYLTDEVEWREGPASLERGAEVAILEGDPGAPGLFTMRIRVPDGFRIAPHWHPRVERVTVLSGTFHIGHGEQFEPARAQALTAGSYTAMPPGMRHFAVAEGETVIQLTSTGPWEIHYVNPADDPRNR